MPPVSPRKMKACFLEEGKMGSGPINVGKMHIKSEHMHIHREFYIDAGVSTCEQTSVGTVSDNFAVFFSSLRLKSRSSARTASWFKWRLAGWAVLPTTPSGKYLPWQTTWKPGSRSAARSPESSRAAVTFLKITSCKFHDKIGNLSDEKVLKWRPCVRAIPSWGSSQWITVNPAVRNTWSSTNTT